MRPANFSRAGLARSVGDALRIADGKIATALREAVGSVDVVHGDGCLPDMVAKGVRAHMTPGELFIARRAIHIDVGHPQARLSLVHEIGHALDYYILGGNLDFASRAGAPDLQDWEHAVMATAPIQVLKGMLGKKQVMVLERGRPRRARVNRAVVSYLLRPEEIFARSYSQYIAMTSRNERLLADVAAVQATVSTCYPYFYWVMSPWWATKNG